MWNLNRKHERMFIQNKSMVSVLPSGAAASPRLHSPLSIYSAVPALPPQKKKDCFLTWSQRRRRRRPVGFKNLELGGLGGGGCGRLKHTHQITEIKMIKWSNLHHRGNAPQSSLKIKTQTLEKQEEESTINTIKTYHNRASCQKLKAICSEI